MSGEGMATSTLSRGPLTAVALGVQHQAVLRVPDEINALGFTLSLPYRAI